MFGLRSASVCRLSTKILFGKSRLAASSMVTNPGDVNPGTGRVQVDVPWP